MLFEVDVESRGFTPVESSRVDVDERTVAAWVDHPGTYGLIGLPKHPAVLETLRLLDRFGPQLLEEREAGEHGLQDRICGLILCADPAKFGGGPAPPGDLCARCFGLDLSYGRLPEKFLLERQPPLRPVPIHVEPPPPPPPGPRILGWGFNHDGQLGDGSTTERDTPVWVPGLTARKIVGGGGATIALASDGTVWSWGTGQLGDGTVQRSSPARIASLTGIVDVAVGSNHAVAVRSDGSVWTWGPDPLLGPWGPPNVQPVQISGLSNAVAVAAGEEFNLVLTRDGRVWSWGRNWSGQLGDGSRASRSNPALVPGLTAVRSIAAGTDCSFAVKVTGDVVAWGSGNNGRLGVGAWGDKLTPVPVSGLTYIQQVSAGFHTMARDLAGDVYVWGLGGNGATGDGSTTDHLSPVKVAALHGKSIRAIAAGYSHCVALEGTRTVWTWGWNGSGQVGDGTAGPGADRLTPFASTLPTGYQGVGVGAGPYWSFAILG